MEYGTTKQFVQKAATPEEDKRNMCAYICVYTNIYKTPENSTEVSLHFTKLTDQLSFRTIILRVNYHAVLPFDNMD